MVEIRDFSSRRNFPGEVGNDFDVILHKYDAIQNIPWPLFAALLFLVAMIPTRADWSLTVGLWLFFIIDWLLLALLPKAGKSFGPPKPPVLVLAVLRALAGWLPLWGFLPLQLLGTLLVIYGFWIEPHHIRVTHQILKSSKIKPGSPIRLLHLGDLHIERLTRREQDLQKLVHTLNPDIILFSGDVLNLSYVRDPQAKDIARQIMSTWDAPYGIYAVLGSPAVDLDYTVQAIYANLPVHLLRGERMTLKIHNQQIDLIGLDCTHRPYLDSPRLDQLVDPLSTRFTIFLYHSPDLAPNAAQHNIDLQLSGHTHGGQVRLPWLGAFFTASLYGKVFEAGRYLLKDLTLYITRGLGMEGAGAPRVRFLCPPEIILWEISAP